MNIEFSPQIFGKNTPNIKFHDKPSSGSPVFFHTWTDRHYEANSRFSANLRTRPNLLFSLSFLRAKT